MFTARPPETLLRVCNYFEEMGAHRRSLCRWVILAFLISFDDFFLFLKIITLYSNSESVDFMEVLVGTNDLYSNGERYKINNYTTHHSYSAENRQNDIAVARIDGEFTFNERVQPIKYSAEEVPGQSIVQFTG